MTELRIHNYTVFSINTRSLYSGWHVCWEWRLKYLFASSHNHLHWPAISDAIAISTNKQKGIRLAK